MRQLLIGPTLLLALYRVIAAGLVIGLVAAVANGGSAAGGIGMILVGPLGVAISVGVGMVCWLLDRVGIPYVGLGTIAAFLGIAGDPILWFIESRRPGTLPVRVFNIFNKPILGVFRDDG